MNQLTVARAVAQVSLEDLSVALQIPVDALLLWESPKCPRNERPDLSEFTELARILDVEPSYLMGCPVEFPLFDQGEFENTDFLAIIRQERIDDVAMFYLVEDLLAPERFRAVVYRPDSVHYVTRSPKDPQPRHAEEIWERSWSDPYLVDAPFDALGMPATRCLDYEKAARLNREVLDSMWDRPADGKVGF